MAEVHNVNVGDEVISWCTKCLEMKPHKVKNLVPGGIPRVVCLCPENSERNYRPTPPKSRLKGQRKVRGTDGINPWREYQSKLDTNQPVTYTIHEIYSEQDVIKHHRYGLGFVVEIVDVGKMVVAFEDQKRLMVFNR